MTTFFNKAQKAVRQIGQKLTAENIHQFGHKLVDTGRVLGRKVSNTLSKISDVGQRVMPLLSTAASMAGYPELAALGKMGEGLKKIQQYKANTDTLRGML